MRRTKLRLSVRRWIARAGNVAAAFFVAAFAAALPLPVQAADPWLFVNDVHFDAASRHRGGPITHGGDTNPALLTSLIAEMRRLAPDPPVIVMPGDFLAHHIKTSAAVPTIVGLARRFNAAFPHAQFVIALGNEDSACGDYALTPDSPFLRAVAAAWAPLVNRRGAAPGFARTFVHDGYYTASLPIPGVRAVIIDNVYWSTFYHTGCGAHGDPTPGSFDELERGLRPAGSERLWLIMHIPPGIDASSTANLIHHLAIVPFLRPLPRANVVDLIADPARRVELVVTGHVHRFSFRLVERKGAAPVPILVSPAVSPILGNLPSFLTADVASDGVVRNLEEHSFVHRRWRDIGGLGTLGTSEFTGPALVNLQHRLERDSLLRAKYAALYMGDSPYHEVYEGNWRAYWCADDALGSTAYRACLDEGGFGFLTRRGVAVVGAALIALLVSAAVGIVFAVRRVRSRRRRAG